MSCEDQLQCRCLVPFLPWRLTTSSQAHSVPSEHFRDTPDLARLEVRLEDWIHSVDERLDQLLEVHSRQEARAKRQSRISPKSTSPRISSSSRVSLTALDLDEVQLDVADSESILDGQVRQNEHLATSSGCSVCSLVGSSSSEVTFIGRGVAKDEELQTTELKGMFQVNGNEPDMTVPMPQELACTGSKGVKSEGLAMRAQASTHRKLKCKFKNETQALRKLNSHREDKDNRSRLRSSDLNQPFVKRCEAVEKAIEKSGGRYTIERLVLSDWFDFTISGILVANSLLIGFEVQWEANGRDRNIILEVMEWVCAMIFAVELLLRVVGRGKDLLLCPERIWTLCDMVLVLFSILDVLFQMMPNATGHAPTVAEVGSSGRLLKIMRMFRILRLLRMVRFLSELRVMAHMIQHSMMSLFWLFTLLFILIYIFSIVLTQGATEYLKIQDDPFIRDRYGSLFNTMYTLFQAMSGGVSWGEVTSPLIRVGAFYFYFSLVYIFFSIFSVLNIVTGVFVDGAIELAKQDRFMMVAKNVQARDASAMHLLDLLREIDKNGDDTLSAEEFQESLSRKDVVEYLEALSVDATEAELLFMLLDKDGDGTVDIEEFVAGMQRLQGEAKSFDVHLLMHANRELQRSCKMFLEHMRKPADPLARLSRDARQGRDACTNHAGT